MASWKIKTQLAAGQDVEEWLAKETQSSYVIVADSREVLVDFLSINDAFRFRLKFDQDIIH